MSFFKPEEFRMDGQIVFDRMNAAFLVKLAECRRLAGIAFAITSSYRSPEKNRAVGGSPSSMHLQGRAVDVVARNGVARWKIVRAALSLGLSVGIMENAVHIDDRAGTPVLFHYYAKKRANADE